MPDILVVNKSTLVSDKETAAMARACSVQLHQHAAPVWFQDPFAVHHADNESEARPGDWVLFIEDDPDEAGVLGWHTQNEQDVIFGRIFARPCVTDGHSTALLGPYSVSSVLSHEILETWADPHVNDWVETPGGVLIAKEVCDPTESDTYTHRDRYAGEVALSNFVGPEWFDANRSPGEKLDYLGRTPAPFTRAPGGYWVQETGGTETSEFGAHINPGDDVVEVPDRGVTYVFGPDFPAWKKPLKVGAVGGRASRRVREVSA